MICQLLLITILSFHTTSPTVYYVVPDDHYTTNNNTYTLQHYLNNISKYFTSHTRLHFLPGQYYLNTDLIIQHVSNLSLIGNRTNEVINSVIKCTSPAGIVVVGSSNIVIANIVMNECGNEYNQSFTNSNVTSLLVFNSTSINILYFHSLTHTSQAGLAFINILQNLSLFNILAPNVTIYYYELHTQQQGLIHVYVSFLKIYILSNSFTAMVLKLQNTSININFTVMFSNFTNGPVLHITSNNCSGYSLISVIECTFTDGRWHQITLLEFLTPTIYLEFNDYKSKEKSNEVKLVDCNFVKFNATSKNYAKGVVIMILLREKNYSTTNPRLHTLVLITRCTFGQIVAMNAITIQGFYHQGYPVVVLFRSMTIYQLVAASTALTLHQINLTIEEMTIENSLAPKLIATTHGHIQFHGYIEISNTTMVTCFSTTEIYLKESVTLNFSHSSLSFVVEYDTPEHPIVNCPFQYQSNKHNLDSEFLANEKLNYSIIFESNELYSITNVNTKWCEWSSSSAFSQLTPFQVRILTASTRILSM